MKRIHRIIFCLAVKAVEFLIIQVGKIRKLLRVRREESRTDKAAPLPGIGHFISQFAVYVVRHHSGISRIYRLYAERTHPCHYFMLKRALAVIPLVWQRTAPSLKIVHLPPCQKCRATDKPAYLFVVVSELFQEVAPYGFDAGHHKRHIDAV